MNFYPRYPADYMSKTLHLTMEQDGAYTRLMDWCYANEKPIPHKQRYAIARAQKASEKRAVDDVLSEFFSIENDVWTNERIMLEMEKDAPRRAAARINGRKGGRPKKPPSETNPSGSEKKPGGFSGSPPEGKTQKAPHTPYPRDVDTTLKARHTHHAPNDASDGVCDDLRPEVVAAKALRERGLRITPAHPGLIAAVGEGVTSEDLVDMSSLYPDKPAGYVIAACRRQHAESAKPITPGEPHANRSPSRKLSACQRTEQRIREERAKRAGVARIA